MADGPPVCDGCGIAKKETNHWYLGWIVDGGFRLVRWSTEIREGLRGGTERNQGFAEVCGRGCAQQYLERYLASPAQPGHPS